MFGASNAGCISFDSYIKPQPSHAFQRICSVVYLLIPTSNHNYGVSGTARRQVVYLLIPTSNHNLYCLKVLQTLLYIF